MHVPHQLLLLLLLQHIAQHLSPPPEVRAEEGCEEDGQVLHKRLVLVAAPAVCLWDVGPWRHQRRQLHKSRSSVVGM